MTMTSHEQERWPSERIIVAPPAADEVLLTSEQVSEKLKMTRASLANQRHFGRGPRYRKLPNGLVRYPDWAVAAWLIGADIADAA